MSASPNGSLSIHASQTTHPYSSHLFKKRTSTILAHTAHGAFICVPAIRASSPHRVQASGVLPSTPLFIRHVPQISILHAMHFDGRGALGMLVKPQLWQSTVPGNCVSINVGGARAVCGPAAPSACAVPTIIPIGVPGPRCSAVFGGIPARPRACSSSPRSTCSADRAALSTACS